MTHGGGSGVGGVGGRAAILCRRLGEGGEDSEQEKVALENLALRQRFAVFKCTVSVRHCAPGIGCFGCW